MKSAVFYLGMILLMAFAFQACEQTVPVDDVVIPDTEYYFALECGWNSGNFTMYVNADETVFIDQHQIQSDTTVVLTDPATWALLSAELDFEVFEQIELNSMDISFDGCDYTLHIIHGSKDHSIRYGGGETEGIEPVKDLIEILKGIREEF